MSYPIHRPPVRSPHWEHELMSRLVDRCATGPDFEPRRQVLLLLQTLGEVSAVVNVTDAGPSRWRNASHDLLNVIVIVARLASHYGLPLYDGIEWPDRTRVGGDGAYLAGHDARHLFAEVVEAAGWVAEWVLDDTASPDWLSTMPITELAARTWHLIDLWDLRETLCAAMTEQLVAG